MRSISGVALGLLFLVSEAAGAELQVGAFAIDVSPRRFPISVNGNFQDVQATGVHDPLHARCLVVGDGRVTFAIAVVDSCMIPRELVLDAKGQAARRTGIPAERILIAATHTHSAPTVAGSFQSEPDRDYAAFLAQRIAEGIETAYQKRKPARIGFARIREETQVFNRRWKREAGLIPPDPFGNTTDQVQMNPGYLVKGLIAPAGPVDPDLFVLAAQTRDGRPLAVLANYSLHYVGGNPPVSADYFGAFADRVKQLVAPEEKDFVAIMSNGTSGDVNNLNYGAPALKFGPGERIKVVADRLARKAVEALAKVEYRTAVPLQSAVREIELGVRKPTAADVEKARKVLAEQPDPKKLTGAPAIYARETVLLADYPAKVPMTLQVLRLGDGAIVAIPCEVFAEIGLEIKKGSPLPHTFTISLANGYNGYLPTPAQHRLGGYETWRARSSYLEVNASETVMRTVQELLKEVHRD